MNASAQPSRERRGRIGFALWAALLAYFGLWTFQGLDMTDEGFHLTQAWLTGRGAESLPLLWLTYVLSGLWLRLTDGLGLLGARLGWALTLSLTGWTAYRVLSAYAPPRRAAAAVAATALIVSHHGNMVINQNNLPFLLLLAAAGLVLAADRAAAPWRRAALALGGGLGLGLATLARLPLLAGWPLALLPALARRCQTRRPAPAAWAAAGWTLAGAAGVLAAAAAVLAMRGRLAAELAALWRPGLHEEYAAAGLLGLYAESALRAARALAGAAVEAMPWAIGLHLLCRWGGLGRWSPALLAASGLVWMAAAARRVGLDAFHWEYFHLLPALVLAAAAALFAWEWRRGGREEEPARRQALLAVAAFLPAAIMAGSNNGVINLTHGLWLVLPAVLLGIPEAAARAGAAAEAPQRRRTAAAYAAAVAAALALASAGIRFVNPYRDSRARWRLTAPIAAERLRGIRTTRGRAESLGAVCAELSRHARPGDRVLVYGGAPLLHYVTRTVPALGHPWPECLGLAELRARLAAVEAKGARPAAVVRAQTAMAARNWGGNPAARPTPSAGDRAREELLTAAAAGWGCRPAWSNADFVILLPASAAARAGAEEAAGWPTRAETPRD